MCGLSGKWTRKLIQLVKIAGCSGASRKHSTRGLWSADDALRAARKSPVLGGSKLRWHTCFKVRIGRYPPAQAACGSTTDSCAPRDFVGAEKPLEVTLDSTFGVVNGLRGA